MLIEGRVAEHEPATRYPTLIYDGDCGFCRRWVGRVRRADRKSAVRYLPLQDAEALALSGRRVEELRQAVHLVRSDGVVFAGAAAVRELLAVLAGGRLLYGILGLPGLMQLSARLYAWVARRYGPVGSQLASGVPGEKPPGCRSHVSHAQEGDV